MLSDKHITAKKATLFICALNSNLHCPDFAIFNICNEMDLNTMSSFLDQIIEMDSIGQVIFLAAVQGITEFMPVSSSGHLILVPAFTGWADQGLVIDVAVHVGTLFAIVLWLHREVIDLILGCWDIVTGRFKTPRTQTLYFVVLATLPLLAVGYWLHINGGTYLRTVQIIAWASIIGGIALWVFDKYCPRLSRLEHMSWRGILTIGMLQTLALIPGMSRSGAVITGARLLGMERSHAARFSFLLALPALSGAGVLNGIDLWRGETQVETSTFLAAAVISATFALIAVWAMMKWVSERSYTPFCLYRIALGIFLLYYFGL